MLHKQPVPPQQDISPTAPTANNNTSPSLIESFTDKSTDTNKYNNNNTDPPDDYLSDDDSYGNCAYDSLDYYDDYADDNNDDDDNDSYASSSSDEDYYNHTNVIIDMYGNKYTVNDDNNIIPYDDDDDDDDDKPMTIQAAQRQINAILAGRTPTTSIEDFTNQTKHEYDEFFSSPHKNADCTRSVPLYSPPKYAKNDDHDAFLYHRWNKTNTNKNSNTIRPSTNKTRPAVNSKTVEHTPTAIQVKDDPSVTPTLKTLCTLDTCSSDSTCTDTDVILSITIWNQPIVQYRMPTRSTIRNQSRHPSTAVQYALIGVYDKLLHP